MNKLKIREKANWKDLLKYICLSFLSFSKQKKKKSSQDVPVWIFAPSHKGNLWKCQYFTSFILQNNLLLMAFKVLFKKFRLGVNSSGFAAAFNQMIKFSNLITVNPSNQTDTNEKCPRNSERRESLISYLWLFIKAAFSPSIAAQSACVTVDPASSRAGEQTERNTVRIMDYAHSRTHSCIAPWL